MIKHLKKAIIMLLFVALVFDSTTINAKEVSVGKVKSVKSKTDYRYYKVW